MTGEDKSDVVDLTDSKEKEEQQNCILIEPEIFEEMKCSDGTSIADLNKEGYKVLIFFTSSVGCIHCRGTIHDIFDLQDELLKLNCIPVIAHEEDYLTYDKFINSSKTLKKFENILHLERKSVKKHFKMTNFNKLAETAAFLKKGIGQLSRLKNLGLTNDTSYFTSETETLLAAVFVIHNKKVVSEYRKEHKYQRFDVARILIDTDGKGIQIRTSIFECEIPKKKKEKLEVKQELKSLRTPKSPRKNILKTYSFSNFKNKNEKKNETLDLDFILENERYFKYFKLHATTEFSVENVIFYEEVQIYKTTQEEQRKEQADKMINAFLKNDSIYEINTSQKLIKQMYKAREQECGAEIFDPILKDVRSTNLFDMYQRFLTSDLYQEMTQKKKKKTYFLFQ